MLKMMNEIITIKNSENYDFSFILNEVIANSLSTKQAN